MNNISNTNQNINNMNISIPKMKKIILDGVKDLDKNDYFDICYLIKFKLVEYNMVTTTEKGTYINLDKLDKSILSEIYSMICTKLQRIKSE